MLKEMLEAFCFTKKKAEPLKKQYRAKTAQVG